MSSGGGARFLESGMVSPPKGGGIMSFSPGRGRPPPRTPSWKSRLPLERGYLSTSLKDALLAPQTAAFMGGVCRLARTQTITVEERFKQSKHNRMACAGNTMHASTAASNRCLSEIRSSSTRKRWLLTGSKLQAELQSGRFQSEPSPISRPAGCVL